MLCANLKAEEIKKQLLEIHIGKELQPLNKRLHFLYKLKL